MTKNPLEYICEKVQEEISDIEDTDFKYISEERYKNLITTLNDHYQREFGSAESGQVEQLTSEALNSFDFRRNLENKCRAWYPCKKNYGWTKIS